MQWFVSPIQSYFHSYFNILCSMQINRRSTVNDNWQTHTKVSNNCLACHDSAIPNYKQNQSHAGYFLN